MSLALEKATIISRTAEQAKRIRNPNISRGVGIYWGVIIGDASLEVPCFLLIRSRRISETANESSSHISSVAEALRYFEMVRR